MPAYPESARRQGVEGVTTLRFQVLTDGSVGEVAIASSAGHGELDQAAVEAIRKWRFEPARRGKEAVVVWVTLPVRFALRNQ
jgi:protein TonB